MPRTLLVGVAVTVFALTVAADTPPVGRKYALLIGVDDYRKAGLANLRFPGRDVTEFAKVLKASGYRPDDVVLMTAAAGKQADKNEPAAAKIVNAMTELLARAGPGDSALVAFAGHGVQFIGSDETYFCPCDANLKDKTTLVSLTDVYRQMETCKAGFKLLISDACRDDPSGGQGRSLAVDSKGLQSLSRPQTAYKPAGVAALFSCSATQVAYEDNDLQHGVFFYHVIEGLKGPADLNGDGSITLNELDDYLQKSVEPYVAKKFAKAQLPNFRRETSGLQPPLVTGLAKRAIAKVAVKPPPKAVLLPRMTEPDPAPKAAPTPKKAAELAPITANWGYKFYLESDGSLTCYGPNGVRGIGDPYLKLKPEAKVDRVITWGEGPKRRFAIGYGKKVAVYDFRRTDKPLGAWPREATFIGTLRGLRVEDGGQTLVVEGDRLYRYGAETGKLQTVDGKPTADR